MTRSSGPSTPFLLAPRFVGSNLNIFVPKRNLVFVITFQVPVSKSRPQYSSTHTSNSNICPQMIIL